MMHDKNPRLAQFYVSKLRNIADRFDISLAESIKQRFCSYCSTLFLSSANSSVRIKRIAKKRKKRRTIRNEVVQRCFTCGSSTKAPGVLQGQFASSLSHLNAKDELERLAIGDDSSVASPSTPPSVQSQSGTPRTSTPKSPGKSSVGTPSSASSSRASISVERKKAAKARRLNFKGMLSPPSGPPTPSKSSPTLMDFLQTLEKR